MSEDQPLLNKDQLLRSEDQPLRNEDQPLLGSWSHKLLLSEDQPLRSQSLLPSDLLSKNQLLLQQPTLLQEKDGELETRRQIPKKDGELETELQQKLERAKEVIAEKELHEHKIHKIFSRILYEQNKQVESTKQQLYEQSQELARVKKTTQARKYKVRVV